MRLPVLTLRQPWAGLVVAGIKSVENRTWKAHLELPFRLLIHAGKGDDDGYDGPWDAACGLRGIIGIVEVIGYVNTRNHTALTVEGAVPLQKGRIPQSDFNWLLPDCDCWVLRRPQALGRPIPAKGKLGIWYADVNVDDLAPSGALAVRSKRSRK